MVGDDGADVEPGSAAVGEVWCRWVSNADLVSLSEYGLCLRREGAWSNIAS